MIRSLVRRNGFCICVCFCKRLAILGAKGGVYGAKESLSNWDIDLQTKINLPRDSRAFGMRDGSAPGASLFKFRDSHCQILA